MLFLFGSKRRCFLAVDDLTLKSGDLLSCPSHPDFIEQIPVYNDKITNVEMKRAQSALTLRHLADSLHSSIQQHNCQIPTNHGCAQPVLPNKEQLDNRIFILEKQIASLERELSSTKSAIRNYTKQLDQYENIAKQMKAIESVVEEKREQEMGLGNRLGMVRAWYESVVFNCQERVAEKEYYEELIDTHRLQYHQESQVITKMAQIQLQTCHLQKQFIYIIEERAKRRQDLADWELQNNYQLTQHKIKNAIKLQRIQLIASEDKCNFFCQTHNLRSLRELHCLFFKQYAKKNGIDHSEADQGMDLFLCRHGLVEEFSEFARERLVYNKPRCQDVEDYLEQFSQMEQTLRQSSCQATRKMHQAQVEELSLLEQKAGEKEEQMKQNQEELAKLGKDLEQQFGKDSLAVIEYLRSKNNKYDIPEIKAALKQAKDEQEKRIKGIKQAHFLVSQLESIIAKQHLTQSDPNRQQTLEINARLSTLRTEILNHQAQLQTLQDQKTALEALINGAITKWRQRDENKVKLKQLYQELDHLKTTLQEKERAAPRPSSRDIPLHKSISFNNFPLKKPVFSSSNGETELKMNRHSKNNSAVSLNQSKSVLSLTNPHPKGFNTQPYPSILPHCQMILSKRISNKELGLPQKSEELRTEMGTDMKKTKAKGKRQDKQNDRWTGGTKVGSLSKYGVSGGKASISASVQGSKMMRSSQRSSLSKLLISKFSR